MDQRRDAAVGGWRKTARVPKPDDVMTHIRAAELSHAELSAEIDWRIAAGDEESRRFRTLYNEWERRCG